MNRAWTLLRYDLPLHFVLLFTNWLPDNVIFLRFRGWLASPFFLKCGPDLRLGRNLDFYNPSKIEIGAHVYIAYGCVFLASHAKIVLDDEVILGPYCTLASDNHSRNNQSFRYGVAQPDLIRLQRGSWLGAHVVVTAGAVVGAGSAVAAGAVVVGKFPPNILLGGAPSRKIKNLE